MQYNLFLQLRHSPKGRLYVFDLYTFLFAQKYSTHFDKLYLIKLVSTARLLNTRLIFLLKHNSFCLENFVLEPVKMKHLVKCCICRKEFNISNWSKYGIFCINLNCGLTRVVQNVTTDVGVTVYSQRRMKSSNNVTRANDVTDSTLYGSRMNERNKLAHCSLTWEFSRR